MDEDPCVCTVCADGAYPPAPAAVSLVGGAIGRSLTDAEAGYRQQLDELWQSVLDAGPWDD